MNVQAILSRKGSDVIAIPATATLKDAAVQMQAHGIAALVAIDDGRAIRGILSQRDIIDAIGRRGPAALGERVAGNIVADLVSVAPGDSVQRAMALMTNHRLRHLPVMDEGKLAGIISMGDLVKHRLIDLELETNVLRDAYIAAH